MPRKSQTPYRKNLLALAISAALAPSTGWALQLVQEPPLPTSKSAFVAPNVIISLDDSGSMRYCLTNSEGHEDNKDMDSVAKRQNNCWIGKNDKGKDIIVKITEEQEPINGVWPKTARRINVLKYALKNVFNDDDLIPENKIRIAWQAMNSSTASGFNASQIQTNSMRPIDKKIGTGKDQKTHRENFLTFVQNFSANGGTPSHKMFSQADAYLRAKLNNNGPWSTDPGGTSSDKKNEYLGCRRNYHIMMTDGRWNGTATQVPDTNKRDNATNLTLGDGITKYTGADSQLYRDTSSGTTLADWAFYSWAVPLQANSALKDANMLKPSKLYDEAPATEDFGTGSNKVTLKKFWNPKYNPANWPHLVTYTIGFSESAYTWDTNTIIAPSDKSPFGYDGSFASLAKGTTTWPNLTASTEKNNALDLWHAALNGRGRFYAIEEGAELEQAFREIIGKINEETAPLPDEIAGGGSTTGYNVSQNNAGIFASVYSPKDGWTGYITATRAVDPEEYECPSAEDPEAMCIRFPDVISEWDGKTTANRLDELASVDNRVILSWSDDSSGVPFKWPTNGEISYSTAQKKSLLGIGANDALTPELKVQAKNIVNYIRGDHSLEGTTLDKPFRARVSRHGDIVNSEIWYTGGPISNYGMGYSDFASTHKFRTPILYVGGNDGMLHGFSAKNGKELIAYVPRGVVGGLKALTDPEYEHRYYVDGSPMTGDIKDGSNWKTLLVGTLGAGGKGYFILDVTNPSSFTEGNASSLVLMDRTRGNNEAVAETDAKDIGNITAHPGRNPTNLQEATQITRLNNGRWAVVMGNGYNSVNRRPVLLIQYLDGDKALKLIQATTDDTGSGNAKDNGLASPALVDLDGDGKTDVVYAGDNLGNLWKFDLTSTSDSDWKVAFGNNKPLFTARGPVTLNSTTRDQVQPITAPPIVRANDRQMIVGTGNDAKTVPVGGVMVAFGTGRNLTEEDRRTDITQSVQTLYSVLDNTRYCMKSDNSSLQVHPGENDCKGDPVTGVPIPVPVGTMANDGKPLAKQTITAVQGDFATVIATQELKKDTWANYKGWYLDLPATGERLLKPMQFYDGSNILAVYTETPPGTKNSESDNINESCVPVKVDTSSGSQFRTLINIMDGKRPSVQLVDFDGNGVYDSGDLYVARMAVKTGTPILITKPDRIVDMTGGGGERDTLARMPEQSTRPSWRQIK
ncbi:MAG TPA: PilC/PilY family type IV pilus protein [Ottowia sp.]|uniref:pilus assembly protein n=1 Tax=Ottowia sp. TaxID=1898956 RepID=UPI002B52C15F|nr:PilC/PilY family type IV pilus protein [Ottowia sp.]HMN20325.1 PilC/PilY family type IV pilus protein [Ottowia sp.]